MAHKAAHHSKKEDLDFKALLNPPEEAIFIPVSPSALKLARNSKTLHWLVLFLIIIAALLLVYFLRSQPGI